MLFDELVPCLAAVVDEIVRGFEDAVGEPVVAHELPDVFDRVELETFRRQSDDCDVGWLDEVRRHVPTSLIDNKHAVGSWCDHLHDFRKVAVHSLGIAGRQYQGRALALLWVDWRRRLRRRRRAGAFGGLLSRRLAV
jgi:hypothetical protein